MGKRPKSSAHEKRDTAPECKRNGTQVIERNTIQSATSKGDAPPARPPRHECETRPRTHERFRCHGVFSRQIKLGPARPRRRNARTCKLSNVGHQCGPPWGEWNLRISKSRRCRGQSQSAVRRTTVSGNATHARVDVDPLHADTGVEVLKQPRGTTGAAWTSSSSREERRGWRASPQAAARNNGAAQCSTWRCSSKEAGQGSCPLLQVGTGGTWQSRQSGIASTRVRGSAASVGNEPAVCLPRDLFPVTLLIIKKHF